MILGVDAWIVWLSAAIVLLLVEATTISLIPIWFACGSILAVFLDWFGLPTGVQLAAMLALSAFLLVVSMFVIRPRLHQSSENAIPSGEFLGHEGIVVDRIDPSAGRGLVYLCDQTWSAGSESGLAIEKDTRVEVIMIRGQKAIVRPIDDARTDSGPAARETVAWETVARETVARDTTAQATTARETDIQTNTAREDLSAETRQHPIIPG